MRCFAAGNVLKVDNSQPEHFCAGSDIPATYFPGFEVQLLRRIECAFIIRSIESRHFNHVDDMGDASNV